MNLCWKELGVTESNYLHFFFWWTENLHTTPLVMASQILQIQIGILWRRSFSEVCSSVLQFSIYTLFITNSQYWSSNINVHLYHKHNPKKTSHLVIWIFCDSQKIHYQSFCIFSDVTKSQIDLGVLLGRMSSGYRVFQYLMMHFSFYEKTKERL